jgi:hypothetical protein
MGLKQQSQFFNTFLTIQSDESTDCAVLCVAWQKNWTAQSALSSAYMVKHVFKITRIAAGFLFNGEEYTVRSYYRTGNI